MLFHYLLSIDANLSTAGNYAQCASETIIFINMHWSYDHKVTTSLEIKCFNTISNKIH